jgi:hypothetical protein
MFKTIGYIFQAINLAIQSLSRLTVSTSEGAEDIVDIARDEIRVAGEGQRTQHVLDRRAIASEIKGHKFTKSEDSYIYRVRRPLLT